MFHQAAGSVPLLVHIPQFGKHWLVGFKPKIQTLCNVLGTFMSFFPQQRQITQWQTVMS